MDPQESLLKSPPEPEATSLPLKLHQPNFNPAKLIDCDGRSESQSSEFLNSKCPTTDIPNRVFIENSISPACNVNLTDPDKNSETEMCEQSTTVCIESSDESKITLLCESASATDVNEQVQIVLCPSEPNITATESPMKICCDGDKSNNPTAINQNAQLCITAETDNIIQEDNLNDCNNSFSEEAEENISEDAFFKDLGIPSQSESAILKTKHNVSKETLKQKKQLEEELRTIHSESQRMARESDVQLPYHKPKVSSLSEFLNRRSCGKENNKSVSLTPKPLDDVIVSRQFETPPTSTKSIDFKTPILSDFKRKLLKETQVLNLTPSLSGKSDFVDLDIAETPKGLNSFMNRFIKQNQKQIPSPQIQEVKLHLVCKDVDKNGKEDLNSKEITVKLNKDMGPTPVNTVKFNIFKEQLLSAITKKKKEKQEKRLVEYELDNEEGFDEEEEMSDQASDEEDSDLEDFLKLGKSKSVEENSSQTTEHKDGEHPGSESNIPKNSKMVRMDSGTLFLEDSEVENSQVISDSQIQGDSERLFLEESQSSQMKLEVKKTEDELDSSFELMGSIIPGHQPGGGLKYGGCQVSEDEATSATTTPVKCHSLFARKIYEENLEFDGFGNGTISSKLVDISDLSKGDIGDTQNVNELLELCSGKFTSTEDQSQILPKSVLNNSLDLSSNEILGYYKDDVGNTQNGNELLALCSGKFSTPILCNSLEEGEHLEGTVQNEVPTSHIMGSDDNNSDEDDTDLIRNSRKIATKKFTKLNFYSDEESDNEDHEVADRDSASKNITPIPNDENCDSVEFQSENNDEEDIDLEERSGDIDSTKPKLMRASDFFEDEAELSGSDVGSEDEYEGDDDEENIFDDNVLSDEEMSTEELRNQIGKVHLKKLLDDDKKELRFFQEVYLEDGDLHTDGNGRERKFRWRNMHENEVQETTEAGSGDENEQNGAEDERWRIQRFEREKWLKEQEELHNNEQWTGFKLNKRNKPSPTVISSSGESFPTNSPFIVDQPKSFLSRNKDFCSQLAEKFQKLENDNVGRRSTKNFVFVSKSPRKQTKRCAEPVVIKEAKIRKLNVSKLPVLSSKKSVFNFID